MSNSTQNIKEWAGDPVYPRNSTQNDWEARYEEFITFVTNEKNWIDGRPVWKEYKYVTLANAIQDFIRQELADARKEVVTEVEKMLWSIHKDEINGANIRWNESLGLAISRLATLGEEEDVEGQMKHWGYGEGIEQTAVKAKGSALTLDKLNES